MWFLAVHVKSDPFSSGFINLGFLWLLAVPILRQLFRVALEVLAYDVFGGAYLERPLSSGFRIIG